MKKVFICKCREQSKYKNVLIKKVKWRVENEYLDPFWYFLYVRKVHADVNLLRRIPKKICIIFLEFEMIKNISLESKEQKQKTEKGTAMLHRETQIFVSWNPTKCVKKPCPQGIRNWLKYPHHFWHHLMMLTTEQWKCILRE